jgi:hypothetical protein
MDCPAVPACAASGHVALTRTSHSTTSASHGPRSRAMGAMLLRDVCLTPAHGAPAPEINGWAAQRSGPGSDHVRDTESLPEEAKERRAIDRRTRRWLAPCRWTATPSADAAPAADGGQRLGLLDSVLEREEMWAPAGDRTFRRRGCSCSLSLGFADFARLSICAVWRATRPLLSVSAAPHRPTA